MKKNFTKITFVDFVKKDLKFDKVEDHFHRTCKGRGPANQNYLNNNTQKQCDFVSFILHNFSNYDCHVFFKKLNDKTKNKVDLDVIPIADEEYI